MIKQQPVKCADLIYDVGLHMGEDTDFYLKKGFRVVAFEADPDLVLKCKARFAQQIQNGDLVIVEGAIMEAGEVMQTGQTVKFFRNRDLSVWGTTDSEWASRNELFGTSSEIIEVPSVDFSSCLQLYGIPYYMKIDIEGMDLVCLKALLAFDEKPDYVSVESEKVSFKKLQEELDLFLTLGYEHFKAINQAEIISHKEPGNSKVGRFLDFKFQEGSSGLFGQDLPGEWKNKNQLLTRYRMIFLGYRLFGDYGILRNTRVGNHLLKIINKLSPTPVPGWYDTHARHHSVRAEKDK